MELDQPPQVLTPADLTKIRDRIREILTSGVTNARKAMCEAMIKEIEIIADDTVRPIFKLPIAGNDEGLALDGPALSGSERAVRALPTMVEVLRRYSNQEYLVKSVQEVLRRTCERDQTDEPGVVTTGGSDVVLKRLSSRVREEVVADFRSGTLIRLIAEKHGVSRSTIQRLLRERGLGRYGRGSG